MLKQELSPFKTNTKALSPGERRKFEDLQERATKHPHESLEAYVARMRTSGLNKQCHKCGTVRPFGITRCLCGNYAFEVTLKPAGTFAGMPEEQTKATQTGLDPAGAEMLAQAKELHQQDGVVPSNNLDLVGDDSTPTPSTSESVEPSTENVEPAADAVAPATEDAGPAPTNSLPEEPAPPQKLDETKQHPHNQKRGRHKK